MEEDAAASQLSVCEALIPQPPSTVLPRTMTSQQGRAVRVPAGSRPKIGDRQFIGSGRARYFTIRFPVTIRA